jgi:hypothetical protein
MSHEQQPQPQPSPVRPKQRKERSRDQVSLYQERSLVVFSANAPDSQVSGAELERKSSCTQGTRSTTEIIVRTDNNDGNNNNTCKMLLHRKLRSNVCLPSKGVYFCTYCYPVRRYIMVSRVIESQHSVIGSSFPNPLRRRATKAASSSVLLMYRKSGIVDYDSAS